jgi:hypothetical protein
MFSLSVVAVLVEQIVLVVVVLVVTFTEQVSL